MSGTKISALQSLDPVSGTSVLPLVSSGTNYKASLQAVKEYVLQGTSVQGVQGRQGIQGSQGIQGRQGAQGTAGEDGTSSNLFFYNANTGAFSGNPGSGSIIWNNASQKDSTAILISHLNSSNVDIDIFLALLRPTEKFTVQDANVSSNYQTWRITGSPTNYNAGTATSYWSFPVELVSSAGTGTTGFANLHALFVALVNGVQGVQGVQGISGVGSSALVNAGTFVTMDNLKATVTTSSNRGLSLAAVSGSFNIRIAGTYAIAGGTGGSTAGVNITTTPSTSMFGWDFVGAGDLATYVITDTTNNRAYRVTMHIGYLYNDNTICIERLV